MHLAANYVHPTPNGGRCRVRIFVSDGSELDVAAVVVVTEVEDNPGQSVTNAIEWIVGETLHAHSLDPSETVVIEHYENGARGTPEDPMGAEDWVPYQGRVPEERARGSEVEA
jgi:hypothetical protein